MPESMSIGEAANAIGISADTLRRWDRAGQVQSYRTDRGFRRIPVSEVARLARRPLRHRTRADFSARNRLHGVVRSVEIDGVMARVEIEAGRSWSPLPSHATRSRTSASHPDSRLRRS